MTSSGEISDERLRRTLQRRGGGGASVDDESGQAVDQEVERARFAGARRQVEDRSTDLSEVVRRGVVPREYRRDPRDQVRLSREVCVEPLHLAGSLGEEGWRVAAKAGSECDMGTEEVRHGALKLVQRPGFGCVEEVEGVLEGSRLEARLRRGKRARSTFRGIRRQRHGSSEEGCRGRDATAGVGSTGRALQR